MPLLVVNVPVCLDKHRFYEVIYLVLCFRALLLNQLPERTKPVTRGIAKVSQVGRVDLRVAAELPYIAVDEAGVQVGGEAVSEIGPQPTTVIVVDVEVVLDRHCVTRHVDGRHDRRHDAPSLVRVQGVRA